MKAAVKAMKADEGEGGMLASLLAELEALRMENQTVKKGMNARSARSGHILGQFVVSRLLNQDCRIGPEFVKVDRLKNLGQVDDLFATLVSHGLTPVGRCAGGGVAGRRSIPVVPAPDSSHAVADTGSRRAQKAPVQRAANVV